MYNYLMNSLNVRATEFQEKNDLKIWNQLLDFVITSKETCISRTYSTEENIYEGFSIV